MTDNPRVEELLEELLDSGGTPEEVCRECPELLPEVRAGWQRLRALKAEVGALFPEPTSLSGATPDGAPPADMTNLPCIRGHEVRQMLGHGGMGVVYKAWHLRLNRPVALKMLLAGPYARPEELERFLREAQAVAGLRHANIVQVHEIGSLEGDGRPYFTMEFVEGGNLAQKLAGTPMPAGQAAALLATLADAVQVAHQSGIVHRDLKPANILLTADGTPKITDFGLARRLEDGGGLTLTGAPVGTPSYMAPEQAQGKKDAIGPGTDVYALGAILYECLTGRPPFKAESAAETHHQVIFQEPASPTLLNPKIPRDLETVCLKCLHKEPVRRYASAQGLADDLRRYLDGKPVLARPVGILERIVKWARRRPALAMFLVLMLTTLGAGLAAGGVLWQQANERSRLTEQRRDRARQAIEAGIDQAYEAGRAERWIEVNRIIESAKLHLPEADSDEWTQRLAEAKRHAQFVQNLEFIRLHSELNVFDEMSVPQVSYPAQAEEFARAFALSPFDVNAPADETAKRVRAFPFAALVVAALDEWALAAYMTGRASLHEQLLSIARLADPDPDWRDRLRSPDLWKDLNGFVKLCAVLPRPPKSPGASQLAITAALHRQVGFSDRGSSILKEAANNESSDFWLHFAYANSLSLRGSKSLCYEAIEPYRIADALRPNQVSIQTRMAACLMATNQSVEGIRFYRKAFVHDPKNGFVRHALVLALHDAGYSREAETECRQAPDADVQNPWAAFSLGTLLSLRNEKEAAVRQLRRACQALAEGASQRDSQAEVLEKSGDTKAALAVYRDAAAMAKTSVLGHCVLAKALSALGRHNEAARELEWTVRELDAGAAFQTVESLDRYANIRIALIESLLASGRFADASAAARRTLQSPHLHPLTRKSVEGHLEFAEKLILITADLPSYLSSAKKPTDRHTHLRLAQWLYQEKRLTAASARCYEAAFAWPGKEFEQHRVHAGCAAALAGCGLGNDAANLAEEEKTALRKLALKWLSDESREVVNELMDGRLTAFQRVKPIADWKQDPELACVRKQEELAKLPEAEQREWRALWALVDKMASNWPKEIYNQRAMNFAPARITRQDFQKTVAGAHAHVDRREWTKAAGIYETLLKDTPVNNGVVNVSEYWFEWAAVQLLAGDKDGYRRSCNFMLETAHRGPSLRPFLVARTCTLAPDKEIDVVLATKLSALEHKSRRAFWAMTEQGALCCRTKQYKEAVSLFEDSLQAEKKPGAAVVNWLWLALAHHHLGQEKEAEARLKMAKSWLDSLGSEYQSTREASDNFHRHNWLEALILRREAETLLRSKGK